MASVGEGKAVRRRLCCLMDSAIFQESLPLGTFGNNPAIREHNFLHAVAGNE
jgi:hypothetical protein